MVNRSSVFGFLTGLGVGAFGAFATVGFNMLDQGISETYGAAYASSLEGESDVLRLLLLERITGMATADARNMLENAQVFDFEKPEEGYLVASLPGRPGQILIATSEGIVVDVLNYCWSHGRECEIFEGSK